MFEFQTTIFYFRVVGTVLWTLPLYFLTSTLLSWISFAAPSAGGGPPPLPPPLPPPAALDEPYLSLPFLTFLFFLLSSQLFPKGFRNSFFYLLPFSFIYMNYYSNITFFSNLKTGKCANEERIVMTSLAIYLTFIVNFLGHFLGYFQLVFPSVQQDRLVRIKYKILLSMKEALWISMSLGLFLSLYWFFRQPIQQLFMIFPSLVLIFTSSKLQGICPPPDPEFSIASTASLLKIYILTLFHLFLVRYAFHVCESIHTEHYKQKDNPFHLHIDPSLRIYQQIQKDPRVSESVTLLAQALDANIESKYALYRCQAFNELVKVSKFDADMRRKIFDDKRSWQLISDICLERISTLSDCIQNYLANQPVVVQPVIKYDYEIYWHQLKTGLFEKMSSFHLYNRFRYWNVEQLLFWDLFTQLASIEALSHLFVASKTEDDKSTIDHKIELARILNALLNALSSIHQFQIHHTEDGGVDFFSNVPTIIINTLVNSISMIIFQYYNQLGESKFSQKHEKLLREFVELRY